MTLPFEYQNASLEFERFMTDARDYAGLATTNMAWNMVVGVLHTFRRRLTVQQVVTFSSVLPPVIRALFLEDWNPDQEVANFATEEQLLAEVRSVRTAHNFSPPGAIAAVATALRNRVEPVEFAGVLSQLPPGAAQFWAGHGTAQRFVQAGTPSTVPPSQAQQVKRQAPDQTPVCVGDAMDDVTRTVQGLRPDHEVMTRQRLPYFVGISGSTVGAMGLSMHLVVIPPGAQAEPHLHIGYETGIYVLEGTVLTRWGHALENEVVSQAGDFLFVPPGVPHEAVNLSATEPARAVVARNHPMEQDLVEPFIRPHKA